MRSSAVVPRPLHLLRPVALALAVATALPAAAADGFFASFDTHERDLVADRANALQVAIGSGPDAPYAAKHHAGYSGAHALHYSSQGGAGRRTLFTTDHLIDADTTLSWMVLPESVGDDHVSSTYVSLDLLLDDGSRLSASNALDQHGVAIGAAAHGASKTLYPQQWARKAVRLSDVAGLRGRRITAIALEVAPQGGAPVSGWLDDIAIAEIPRVAPARPSDWVLTTRGTQSNGTFSRGNNFPATAVPHGFNFWTPATDAGTLGWLYRWNEHNGADNRPRLQALSLSHQPSPWMGDRQTFQVMPSKHSGAPEADRVKRALAFSHANEVARPYRYAVQLDNGIRPRSPHRSRGAVPLPLSTRRRCQPAVRQRGCTRWADPGCGHANALGLYRCAQRPVHRRDAHVRVRPLRYAMEGERPQRHRPADGLDQVRCRQHARSADAHRHVADLAGTGQAQPGPGDRATGLAGARGCACAGRMGCAAWAGRSGGRQRRSAHHAVFNLYRLHLYPNSAHENAGSASAPDWRYASQNSWSDEATDGSAVRSFAPIRDGRVYVNNGLWDTFRTAWPAYALFAPEAGALVQGFLEQARAGGWVARWSSPGYADLMVGTSSDVAFADAWRKGVQGFDPAEAYAAALKNATVVPPDRHVGRKGMARSTFRGYADTDTHEGMSWSMEGALNDFGIAGMADALAQQTPDAVARERYATEALYFRHRAAGYAALFDPAIGFFQGRTPDGGWRLDAAHYDPREWGNDYTESSGWTFAFTAPHDGEGLAALYGGRDALATKLDTFFATPETAQAALSGSYRGVIHEMTEARDVRMGMYAHSNQTAHHIPWMYLYAGQPWKTQQLTREILARLYLGGEIGQGYAGDEDNGEMSAWYLFAALGMYPLRMGAPEYVIGSPLFTHASVQLPNGRTLTVNAPQNSPRNVYVQSLKVNGKPWRKTWLPHADIAEGATLDFVMGPRPSRWGTDGDAAPPSLTPPGQHPAPLQDLLGTRARITRDDGGAVDALHDDDAATMATLSSTSAVTVSGIDAGTPTLYTLTSGNAAITNGGWTLEARTGSGHWTVIDQRRDEMFRWPLQTRPFRIAAPGAYTDYRLRVSTLKPVQLAEIELLRAAPASP